MQVEKITKDKIVSNSFWKLLETIGVQAVQLIVTVLLARILGPDEYGLMALVYVAVNFLGLFINSSIASYLVYIKDIRKEAFLTALITNFLVSIILVLLLIASADYIADYYRSPSLSLLLCVMSIVLPLNSISSIYNAYAMKMSLFKALFFRNIIALPISGVVALTLALSGMGIWALVLQQITYSFLLCIIVVFSIKINIDGFWHIDRKIIAPMFKYGGMMLLTSFIAFISDNISDLLIGKRINSKQLGYYNRGNYLPAPIAMIANNVLVSVFFPAFASYSGDKAELKEKLRKSIIYIYYIVLPLFLVLILCSRPLIILLLSEKWLDIIPIVQILCAYYIFFPFLQVSSQLYLAEGYLKIRYYSEILKMILTVSLLLLFVEKGIVVVALIRLFVNLLLVLYTAILNRKYVKYNIGEFVNDLKFPITIGMLMVCLVFPIQYLCVNNIVLLILQVFVSFLVYLSLAWFFKIKEIYDMIQMIVVKFKR